MDPVSGILAGAAAVSAGVGIFGAVKSSVGGGGGSTKAPNIAFVKGKPPGPGRLPKYAPEPKAPKPWSCAMDMAGLAIGNRLWEIFF